MLSAIREKMPFESRKEVYSRDSDNADLRKSLEKDFHRAVAQTKNIAHRFKGANAERTAQNVHKFLRENFVYLKDSPEVQTLKLPSVFIRHQFGDCKSYSLFASAILANLGYPVAFRYASYSSTPIPSHVYVVIPGDTEIIIDGTSPVFNDEKTPTYSITKNLTDMKVVSLSDEVLANDAAISFREKLQGMTPQARRKLMNSFSPANQQKILRSLRSINKIEQLNEIRKTSSQGKRTAISLINNSNQWQTWGEVQFRWNNPYSVGSWATGNDYFLNQHIAEENLAGNRSVNNQVLAGKFGRRFLSIFNKINPVIAIGRGAFMAIVALNLFKLGVKMQKIIDGGKSDRLKEVWGKMGGKWDRLTKAIAKGSDTWRDEQAEIAIKLNEERNKKLKEEAEKRNAKLVAEAEKIREEKRQEAANSLGIPVANVTDSLLQQYLTAKKKEKMKAVGLGEVVTGATAAAATTVLASMAPVIKKVLGELGDSDDNSILDKGLDALKTVFDKTEIRDKAVGWFEDKLTNDGKKDDDTSEITQEEAEEIEDDLENNFEPYSVQVSESDTQKKRDKLSGKLNPESPNYDPELVKKYAEEKAQTESNYGGLAVVGGLAALLFFGMRKSKS